MAKKTTKKRGPVFGLPGKTEADRKVAASARAASYEERAKDIQAGKRPASCYSAQDRFEDSLDAVLKKREIKIRADKAKKKEKTDATKKADADVKKGKGTEKS